MNTTGVLRSCAAASLMMLCTGLATAATITLDDITDTISASSSGFLVTNQNPDGTADCKLDRAEHMGCTGTFYSHSAPLNGAPLFGDVVLVEQFLSANGDPIFSDLIQFNVVSSVADAGATAAGFQSLVTITVSMISDTENEAVTFRRSIVETGRFQDITGDFYDPLSEQTITLPQDLTVIVRSDVPEPSTLVLAALALSAVFGARRARVRGPFTVAA